jgi:hypothetical protein
LFGILIKLADFNLLDLLPQVIGTARDFRQVANQDNVAINYNLSFEFDCGPASG